MTEAQAQKAYKADARRMPIQEARLMIHVALSLARTKALHGERELRTNGGDYDAMVEVLRTALRYLQEARADAPGIEKRVN